MTVASDASPLIWLSQTSHFDLLRIVFGTVVIAPEVWVETVDKALDHPNAANVKAAVAAGWMSVIAPADNNRVATLKAQLHAGEAETLVMAREQSLAAVLVDDLQARNFATAMGLKVIGTAGIMLLARQRGVEVDVKAALDKMRSLGFWLVLQRDLEVDEIICIMPGIKGKLKLFSPRETAHDSSLYQQCSRSPGSPIAGGA